MIARSTLDEAVARAHAIAERSGVRQRVALCRDLHLETSWAKVRHFTIAPTGPRLVVNTEEPPC